MQLTLTATRNDRSRANPLHSGRSSARMGWGRSGRVERRTITKRNSYAPYCEVYGSTVIDGTGYTGHVMDQATGLVYMQQRYYDPQMGRFLSTDPIHSEFSEYSYAANNPFRFVDPDGRKAAGKTDDPRDPMSDPDRPNGCGKARVCSRDADGWHTSPSWADALSRLRDAADKVDVSLSSYVLFIPLRKAQELKSIRFPTITKWVGQTRAQTEFLRKASPYARIVGGIGVAFNANDLLSAIERRDGSGVVVSSSDTAAGVAGLLGGPMAGWGAGVYGVSRTILQTDTVSGSAPYVWLLDQTCSATGGC